MEYFTTVTENGVYEAANGLRTTHIEHLMRFGYMITFEDKQRFQMASLISSTNPYHLLKRIS